MSGIEGENKSLDFSKFISMPKVLQKASRMFLIEVMVLRPALAKRRMSSVKRRWEIVRSEFLSLKGFHSPRAKKFEIWTSRYSTARIKR